MLTATEFFPNTTLLTTVLWVEALIYLSLGLWEMFDDFFDKPRPWMRVGGRVNGYLRFQHKVGHKMHAGICVLLGFVALNGALEGQVTRFELELIFLSFALIMPVLWATFLPGRLGFVVILTKPEFWLQIIMFASFAYLIRPEMLALCVLLNVWGVAVYFLHTRRTYFTPYTYASLRKDMAEVESAEMVARLDRMALHTAEVEDKTSPASNAPG